MFNKQGLSHKLMAKWTEYSFSFELYSVCLRCMQSALHAPSLKWFSFPFYVFVASRELAAESH